MIYALDRDHADELVKRSIEAASEFEGVDLIMTLEGTDEAVVRSRRGELRFTAGGDLIDLQGRALERRGRPRGAASRVAGRALSHAPSTRTRSGGSGRRCTARTPASVLLSAAPGYEFVDWGGSDHVGGGSHGSLHRSDSLGALLWCGTGPDSRDAREQWSLRDVTPMVLDAFRTRIR